MSDSANPDRAEVADDEMRNLMRLGLPLMGAQLAQMSMGVLDTVMAGRLSAVDLAGIGLLSGLAIVSVLLNYRFWSVSGNYRLIDELSGVKNEPQFSDRNG